MALIKIMTSFNSRNRLFIYNTSFLLYILLCISSTQARPYAASNAAAISSPSLLIRASGDAYATDTPSSSPNNYSEPPAPSSSLFPHLSIVVQIAIIGGSIILSILGIIAVFFAYLRHRTKLEIKEERRRTALRMSIMAQQRDSLLRRRKSQLIIMEALERLRDDPEERPALPMRASIMPTGVTQSGLKKQFDDGLDIQMREISLDDKEDDMFQMRSNRRRGFI